jgi:hypothetical protein
LEGDRIACLMLRVAARGLVDFSKIRWFDDIWYRQLSLMMRVVEAEDLFALRGYELQRIQQALDRGTADPAAREKLLDVRDELIDRQFAHFRPWEYQAGHVEAQQRTEAVQLTSAWERQWGNMNDPEVQARIQQVADALLHGQPEAPPTAQSQAGIFNRHTASTLSQKPRT